MITPWRRLGKVLVVTMLLCGVASSVAAQVEPIDPSKPTNLYTNIDFNFELQDHKGDGDLYGLNIIPAFAFDDKNRLEAEIPILRTAYVESENKTAIGDVRLRYFHVPYKAQDPARRLTAAGLSLDVFLPTGDPESGHGSGSGLVAPGFTFGVRAADWLAIFPILSYQHSFKAGRREPGGGDGGGITPPPEPESPSDEEVQMRGLRVEVAMVITLPGESWFR